MSRQGLQGCTPLMVICCIALCSGLASAARRYDVCLCEHFGDVLRVIRQDEPGSLV
jgi:hypothetical protein